MKVLLTKDVYKLGRAGDVKKVADGYGRNFLIPMGYAVLATQGALKSADAIRKKAATERAELNNEMSGLAEQIAGLSFSFTSKAGETGKLYGSITTQMIADALNEKLGITKINRHQIECAPIRTLGEFPATVRLTMDLNPEIKVKVLREGAVDASEKAAPAAVATETAAATEAEVSETKESEETAEDS